MDAIFSLKNRMRMHALTALVHASINAGVHCADTAGIVHICLNVNHQRA